MNMARISIFFTIVALIAIIAGCVGGDGDNGGGSYTLIVDFTTGGTVTVDNVPLPGKSILTYDPGTVVSLSASPSAGYRFTEWTGNATTIANTNAASTTITLNDSYSVTAHFVAQYVLTIDSTDGGEVVSPGEGIFTYDPGTVVDLVAVAEEGYKFLNWTGDIDTIDDVNTASTTITMEGDCAVTGNFTLEYIYFDMIGPGPWGLHIIGAGVNATVTKAGLAVDFASDPEEDPEAKPNPVFAADGYSDYLLEGDFDIRMQYELTIWPLQSGVRVGLSIGIPDIPDMFVNVERVGAGPPESWLDNREVYLVNWNNSVLAIITTDDLSGTLRICREGSMVSCYYGTSEGWHELYRAEWSAENVGTLAHTWSHEHLFGGKEVSVLMRTVEFVEPLP
jgi:hypothetical protein